MKKLFVIAVAVILVASAIPSMAAEISLIPKAGLNLSSMSGDTADELKEAGFDQPMKMGICGGLGAEFGFGSFAIETGLYYSQLGCKWKMEEAGVVGTITRAVDYLILPVLGKAVFGTGPTKFAIGAGPSLGFLLSSKIKSKVEEDGTTVMDVETDVKDYTESTYFGLTFGAGVEISNFIISASYTLGLSNINKASEGFTGELPKDTGNAISILVGYKFGL